MFVVCFYVAYYAFLFHEIFFILVFVGCFFFKSDFNNINDNYVYNQ